MKRGRVLSAVWPRLVCGLGAVAYLEGVRALAGAPFEVAEALLRWLLVQGVLEGALWIGRIMPERGVWVLPRRFACVTAVLACAAIVYVATVHTVAAWAVYVLSCVLLVAASSACQDWRWAARALGWGFWAVLGGVLPVLIGQIESHFAEEEFFGALQVAFLTVFSGLIVVARFWVSHLPRRSDAGRISQPQGLRIPVPMLTLGLGVALVLGGGLTVRRYQRSAYPTQAPSYPGISGEHPFLCGTGRPDPAMPGGQETFQRLLARVQVNPRSTTTKYGMSALATGERVWAEAFREAILEDARSAKYTGSANSVKSTQYLASRLSYYFGQMVQGFPDLLSPEETEFVRSWLTAVNRRALTVEWVDWLYALSFSYWPEGPYENQENGAGLLALLSAQDLTDDTWTARNREYLERNRRGWYQRFRNTDDAYVYQAEWIDNALFQYEYWGDDARQDPQTIRNRRLSFEWLLLQALPDGSPVGYNYPTRPSIAQTAYLGATTLQDPRYVWWSARMLDWAEKTGAQLYAQPGVEQAISLVGVSPEAGSCLLYGDSGLPRQQGPLAPDKVVFRDGWTPDSRYVLLNLRFSGWHRYKATNTVTLIYHGAPLVLEQDSGERFSWLPVGRSFFRDKRIPRENLNGLLVPRTGMASVPYELTGLGGSWAQDPPHYAEVVAFGTGEELDWSQTRLTGWRGWQHDRWVYFYRDGGPIVVVDEAVGPSGSEAALAWHLTGEGILEEGRITLREGEDPAELVLVLTDAGGFIESANGGGSDSGPSVWVRSPAGGYLRAATVLLLGEWVGAEVEHDAAAETLRITRGPHTLTVPLRREA